MKRTLLCLTAMSVALSGCANSIAVKQDVDRDSLAATSKVNRGLQQMPVNQNASERLLYTTEVPGSWMGVSAIKAPNANPLPDVFNKDVTLVFPDRANLSTIAERLTKVTGIPVKLRPDVFIKASALIPKGGSNGGGGGGGADSTRMPLPPVPGMAGGIVGSTVTSEYSLDMTMNFTGNLSSFLDTLCAKAGINWEYRDGSIVLYRLVTKTFVLKSTPGSSELKASVGKSGNEQTGASGGSGGSSTTGSFSTDSMVKMDSSFSVWDNLKSSVNAMLSPVGKAAVTEATGTITVTDTREAVDQIGQMIDQVNKSLSRQVAFRVEVLSVQTSADANYGINWNAIFNKVVANNPSWKFAFGSPSSLVGGDAGGIGYQVLTPPGASNGRSALSGSQVMLQALSSIGKANVVTTASALTLNRQPVPVAITDQTGYVQSVTVQNSGSSSGGSGGSGGSGSVLAQVNPGTVTTGFVLNLLPSITDDNSVMLQFSVDISTLKALSTFGQGPMQVQTPEVSSMKFMQRVGLKNGETLVLSGFERTTGQYDSRTLGKNTDLLLGGSMTGSRVREGIIILITPVVSEGA